MLIALEHQKPVPTKQQAHLEKELLLQKDEQERIEGLLGSVTRDCDDMRKEVQTLSEQLTQALKQIGDLIVELGQTPHMIQQSTPVSQPLPTKPTTSFGCHLSQKREFSLL